MAQLMISVSGVRGIYGDGLDDAVAEKFAYSYGTIYSGTVVIGRDSRKSGEALMRAVISGLTKAGADVIDLGLTSTPTVEMAVTAKNASGGVIITASHNPGEWNGLKFLGPDGVFLDAAEGEKVLDIFHATDDISAKSPRGTVRTWNAANKHHIDSIFALDMIDTALIASRKFTVCLDTVNGAGGPICSHILEKLGCDVHPVNTEPTGDFAHGAEPVAENLGELCRIVKAHNADIGFAVDPDVDRLSIVNEHGVAIGEEYTLALVIDYLMSKSIKTAACNLSTSRMNDDAAAKHGGIVHRAPVGEINVVRKMREVGARIGGEGNGGVILSALHEGRDAVLGIALILQFMAESGKTIGELAASIPSYSMIKEKISITERNSWITPLKQQFAGTQMDEQDGVKIILPDSWVHVRQSNTEPIVRVIAEAPTEKAARELMDKVYAAIG
ncbi:phosphoglucosamine mutase [Candidatus Latescibacterota bacterium]